jgi:hypothetical protein
MSYEKNFGRTLATKSTVKWPIMFLRDAAKADQDARKTGGETSMRR